VAVHKGDDFEDNSIMNR